MSAIENDRTLQAPGAQPGVGSVLNGKYRIEKVIGIGGMGIVYAAHHEQLGERVALKLMLSDMARRPEAVARFINEARAAAKIKNEHVARVMDVGTIDGDGGAFMALEFLEGHDVEQILEARGRLSASEAVDYVLQALEAIAQAHALGIVHRDLKPANLFMARQQSGEDIIKVLDFGISKAQSGFDMPGGGGLTSTQEILGSPLYMSPEQLRSSRTVDARADIWSIGVILYELTTGIRPFDGETAGAVFAAILVEVPVPPRQVCPELPPDLERVILKCLARAADDRYQDVAHLAAELAPFAPHGHTSAPKVLKTLASPAESRPQLGTARDSNPALPRTSPTPVQGTLPMAYGARPDQGAVHAASASPGSAGSSSLVPRAGLSGTSSSWDAGRAPSAIAPPKRGALFAAGVAAPALLVLGLIGFVGWGRIRPVPVAAASAPAPATNVPASVAGGAVKPGAVPLPAVGAANVPEPANVPAATLLVTPVAPLALVAPSASSGARSPESPGASAPQHPIKAPAVAAPIGAGAAATPLKSFQRDRN